MTVGISNELFSVEELRIDAILAGRNVTLVPYEDDTEPSNAADEVSCFLVAKSQCPERPEGDFVLQIEGKNWRARTVATVDDCWHLRATRNRRAGM